jgi:hypothetical protein
MAWDVRKAFGWLRIFRLELHRKTDFLAFAAFLLSLGGILYQILLFTRGADIVQFPPEQILFFTDRNNNVDYVHVGAQVSCINQGKGDKNAVLKLARVIFDLGGKTYELKWATFEEYSGVGNELKHSANPRPATPKVIKSGEGFTEEVHFAPRTERVANQNDLAKYKNYVSLDRFISELEKLEQLEVRIITEFYGLRDKEAKVYIQITPVFIQALKSNKWYAPSCWER